MITPTPGRIVWFYPSPGDFRSLRQGPEPMAAIVAHVSSDRRVNLTVFDHMGTPRGYSGVPLLQDDDTPPAGLGHACWMPYQKGQAAKHDAAPAT